MKLRRLLGIVMYNLEMAIESTVFHLSYAPKVLSALDHRRSFFVEAVWLQVVATLAL